MPATNRFVFGDHAVTNNLAARVSPRMSSVARIRQSVLKSPHNEFHSAPRPRPAGTSTTIHNANAKRASQHTAKANRARSMPSGMRAKHISNHSPLQRSYLIGCSTSKNSTAHPDPMVLDSLESGLLTVDVLLYEDEDFGSVERLLSSKVAEKELEGICVSCGELRGASSSMRRVGWETSDLPRSVLVGGPRSPSKVKERGTNGRCKGMMRAIARCLSKCENLVTLEFCGINLTR